MLNDETVNQVRKSISGLVAVAQFAREDWIDDPEAIEAGYSVADYDDEMIGQSPATPVFMEGPGEWRPAFRPDQAWRELGSGVPMTIDYRPDGAGRDALSVTMVIAGERGSDPLVVTIGCSPQDGLHADPATVEALGGAEADGTRDDDSAAAPKVRNLADAGVESGELERVWQALNEVAHSHPAAMIWHEEMGGIGRDLPHYEALDRARGGIDAMPPPDGAKAPAQAAGTAGATTRELVPAGVGRD